MNVCKINKNIDNQINDEGIIEFSNNLKYIPKLSELNIESNDIGYESIRILSENLKYISNLSTLDIGSI